MYLLYCSCTPPRPPRGRPAAPAWRVLRPPASASFTTYVDTIKYTTHTYTVQEGVARSLGPGCRLPARPAHTRVPPGIGVAASRVSVHAPRHERQHRRRARRHRRLLRRLRRRHHRRRQRQRHGHGVRGTGHGARSAASAAATGAVATAAATTTAAAAAAAAVAVATARVVGALAASAASAVVPAFHGGWGWRRRRPRRRGRRRRRRRRRWSWAAASRRRRRRRRRAGGEGPQREAESPQQEGRTLPRGPDTRNRTSNPDSWVLPGRTTIGGEARSPRARPRHPMGSRGKLRPSGQPREGRQKAARGRRPTLLTRGLWRSSCRIREGPQE